MFSEHRADLYNTTFSLYLSVTFLQLAQKTGSYVETFYPKKLTDFPFSVDPPEDSAKDMTTRVTRLDVYILFINSCFIAVSSGKYPDYFISSTNIMHDGHILKFECKRRKKISLGTSSN